RVDLRHAQQQQGHAGHGHAQRVDSGGGDVRRLGRQHRPLPGPRRAPARRADAAWASTPAAYFVSRPKIKPTADPITTSAALAVSSVVGLTTIHVMATISTTAIMAMEIVLTRTTRRSSSVICLGASPSRTSTRSPASR